jgi:hypothetical protein
MGKPGTPPQTTLIRGTASTEQESRNISSHLVYRLIWSQLNTTEFPVEVLLILTSVATPLVRMRVATHSKDHGGTCTRHNSERASRDSETHVQLIYTVHTLTYGSNPLKLVHTCV